jgi:hypothetical protein
VVGATAAGGSPVEGPDPDGGHSHHWMIAKQDGPSSEGVCKACGEVREFQNGFRRSYPSTFRVPVPGPPGRP